MARVRRLVVSQIEGDYSNDSDKRPIGEISLYEDGDGGFDLVIHDGVNGTSDNKVLGKGKFYGHGSDSGDGNGYDTIKLIPDTNLYGNDQYIIVDPTAPGHIHLRAGGTIDNSNAELYLGGENYHVRVDDNSSVIVSAKSGIVNPNPGDLISSNIYVASGQVSISYAQQGDIAPEGRFQWDFNSTTGLLQLANGIQFGDETIQNTAWTGGRVVDVPGSSLGVNGDLQGDLAFSEDYIYYCVENYGGTQYEVVHGVSSPANGVDNGYLVYDNYQLPQVGWQVNYNGNSAIIDQVNSSNPGYYIVFVSTPLVIPGDATFYWGPLPSVNIWKRLAWSAETW